jgi:hypothetical protein
VMTQRRGEFCEHAHGVRLGPARLVTPAGRSRASTLPR